MQHCVALNEPCAVESELATVLYSEMSSTVGDSQLLFFWTNNTGAA